MQGTFIYVTKNVADALTMGTRVVILKDGFIQQIDTPSNLYDYPANSYVAFFVGSPTISFIRKALLVEEDGAVFAVCNDCKIALSEKVKNRIVEGYIGTNKQVTVGIRPEVKDHGEGGLFVGKQLVDGERVILIEDVMTSGKALREMLPKLEQAANVKIAGMVISVDRMEKGLQSELSAVQEVCKEFGVKVYSIVTMADIIDAIECGVIDGKEYLEKMKEYRKTYGVD